MTAPRERRFLSDGEEVKKMWNDNREFDSMIYLLYCALNDAAPDASRLEGIDGGKFAALCK